MKPIHRLTVTGVIILALPAALAACQPEAEIAAPEPRPVRTITVEKQQAGSPATFTGRIEALGEASLGFRIAGRILENDLKLGDRVEAGQVLARLEPQNEMNALRSAKANLAAAQGELTRARNHFERQEFLLARDVVSRATFDDAQQQLQTARSQVDAAEAQLKAAHDLVSFTELKADAPGLVTATGPRAGEVVQAGQMIVTRDLAHPPACRHRRIARQAHGDLRVGRCRADQLRRHVEDCIAPVLAGERPQANPVTRTFEVKVGLTDPPATMRLGATVTGRMQSDATALVEIPASALTRRNGRSAVWIVDPSSLTVSMRDVDVLHQNPATVAIAQGLETGEIVVTAGARSLHAGQKIRLPGS